MKNIFKIISVLFVLLGFTTNVYAGNSCYCMPGNSIVIPKDHYAKCVYKHNKNLSNTGYSHSLEAELVFYKDAVYLYQGNIMVAKVGYNYQGNPDTGQDRNLTWGSLHLRSENGMDKSFTMASGLNEVKGCPKAIYWMEDNNNLVLGFSNSSTPNISHGNNASYEVYSLDFKSQAKYFNPGTDNVLLIPENDDCGFTKHFVHDEDEFMDEMYADEVAACDKIDKVEFSGNIYTPEKVTTKEETLAECKYYFPFKDSKDNCSSQSLTIAYKKVTSDGKSTYSVVCDEMSGAIKNIDLAVQTYSKNNNYKDDLLQYVNMNGDKWTCRDDLYIFESATGLAIIGKNKYKDAVIMEGADKVNPLSTVNSSSICPPEKTTKKRVTTEVIRYEDGYCPLGPDVTKDLYGVLRIMKILAPLLCIALSVFDAVKAVTKGDGSSELKPVAMKFLKRMGYAIILFFLPILVDQGFKMANVWDANGTCDLFNPQVIPTKPASTRTTTTSSACNTITDKSTCDHAQHCEWDGRSSVCKDFAYVNPNGNK